MLHTKAIKVMMLFVMRQDVFVVPSSARQQHAVHNISIRHVYVHLICSKLILVSNA